MSNNDGVDLSQLGAVTSGKRSNAAANTARKPPPPPVIPMQPAPADQRGDPQPPIKQGFSCPALTGKVIYEPIQILGKLPADEKMRKEFMGEFDFRATAIHGGVFHEVKFKECFLLECLLVDCVIDDCITSQCQELLKPPVIAEVPK